MNIECDSNKEALLGVSRGRTIALCRVLDLMRLLVETILFYIVHRSQFACACRAIAEGITVMDIETRPYRFQPHLDGSRHGSFFLCSLSY